MKQKYEKYVDLVMKFGTFEVNIPLGHWLVRLVELAFLLTLVSDEFDCIRRSQTTRTLEESEAG